MKSKILTLVIIAICGMQDAISCRIWPSGKMYIVDENNNPLHASVWRFYSSQDSFMLGKGNYWGEYGDTTDSDPYIFWGGGGNRYYESEGKKPANKYLRIKAEGYADVIIEERIVFIRKEGYYYYDKESLPVLVVKMYPKKYVRKGDLFTLMNSYVYEKNLEVKDSLVIGFDDYIESIREANTVANAQRVATYVVRTYPNPVKDKLNIEINLEITKPYKAILCDIQGKQISESQLLTQNSVLDMEWETAGIYFIRVYDPEGLMLYSLKIIKT